MEWKLFPKRKYALRNLLGHSLNKYVQKTLSAVVVFVCFSQIDISVSSQVLISVFLNTCTVKERYCLALYTMICYVCAVDLFAFIDMTQ